MHGAKLSPASRLAVAVLCCGLLCAAIVRAATPQSDRVLASLDHALARGDAKVAHALAAELLVANAVNYDTLLGAGVRLAQREMFQDASLLFARCVKDYPDAFEARHNLALSLVALNRSREALQTLSNGTASNKSEEIATLHLKGVIQASLGDTAQAESNLAAALDGAPSVENYASDLGLLELRTRAYGKALRTFQRGLEYHPDSSYLLLGLSVGQALQGLYQESMASSALALKYDPSMSLAQLLVAFTTYLSGDFEKAHSLAGAALRAGNTDPYLRFVHASSALRINSKDYDNLVSELDEAIRAIPRCVPCYVARSKVRQEQGDLSGAIADLAMVTNQLDATFGQAWYRLAALYNKAGNATAADGASARFHELKQEQINRDAELLRQAMLRKPD